MYIVSNNGIEIEKIEEFEKTGEFTFPEDYKDFLHCTNGGILNDEIGIPIDIPNTNIKIFIKKFYGIGTGEDSLEAVNWHIKEELIGEDENTDSDDNSNDDSSLESTENLDEVQDDGQEELSTDADYEIENKLLVIGEDILGQLIVLNFVRDISYICYWDKDMKNPNSTVDENAYYIADSFEELVYMIEKNEKGDENMGKIDYLPLGSIVLMDGGIQKILITSRGLVVAHNDEQFFFDYAGVPYPQGLISDDLLYFNHENIAKVVFEGFKDDDDAVIVNNINRFIEDHPNMIKGDPQNWE